MAKMKYRDKAILSRNGARLLGAAGVCVLFVSLVARQPALPPKGPGGLRIVDIPRIQAGMVDAREFFAKFGDDTPVIVEGEVRHHPAYNMSFDALKEVCGNSTVETKTFDKNANLWGGLVDRKHMLMSEYIDDNILNRGNLGPGEQPRYLTAGLGLPVICPRLTLLTPIPKYVSLSIFPTDPLQYQRTKRERNQFNMPVMFIGNKGTKTEMHVDTMLGPFWMSVYSGSKTFRVVTYWDARRKWDLYNTRGEGNHLIDQRRWERDGEIMEIWDPNLAVFPELGEVTIYEGKVNAGDWIYLPSAALHGVRNDDLSFGITVNALYTPTMDKQVDICADAGYRLFCDEYSMYSVCPDFPNVRNATARSKRDRKRLLKRCFKKSTLVQGLKRDFDEGKSRDMLLHEISGFDDYQSWCRAQCDLNDGLGKEGQYGVKKEDWKHLMDETRSQCAREPPQV